MDVPATAAPGSGEEFLDAFDALAQAIRRARGTGSQAEDGALTLSQYALLQALATRKTARVRELAEEAGITASTATRILDALERHGIVRRARAREDRRGVTVSLTQFGEQVLSSQHEWLRGRQLSFYAELPPRQRELAADLLVRLARLVDELAAGPRA